MVNHENKFIFIHISKTGGSSIYDFFLKNGFVLPNTATSHFDPQINSSTIRKFDTYFKFAFHRNPWDRMVSLWKYWIELRGNEMQINKLFAAYPEARTFSGFCYNLSTIFYYILPITERVHVYNQSDLNGYKDYLKIDFWGRFKYLQEDFNIVSEILGLPKEDLPHVNKTKHDDYKSYYDEPLKKLIGKIYEKDIDTFKYTFDN